MSSAEYMDHLSALKLTQPEAAQLLGVSERTVRRWTDGEAVPGPVEAALRAWRRLDQRYLPWRPDAVSVFHDDQDQISRIRDQDQLLDALMREVEARGGPKTPWSVDLVKQRATLGPAEVSFHRLEQGGFSPTSYRRVDRTPSDADRPDIQDACYCIAQAIARSRAANQALISISEQTRQRAAHFVRDGASMPTEAEVQRRVFAINMLADELNGLASSAVEGNAIYGKFEEILNGLHRLGFFPDSELVAGVARSILGPAPRPDILTKAS